MVAADDLVGAGSDGLRLVLGDDAQLGVDPGGRLLHPGDRHHVCRLEGRAADREVLDRALGLGSPQGVRGNLDVAHAVVLGPGLALVAWLFVAHGDDVTEFAQERRERYSRYSSSRPCRSTPWRCSVQLPNTLSMVSRSSGAGFADHTTTAPPRFSSCFVLARKSGS